jgi:hypothetical protein
MDFRWMEPQPAVPQDTTFLQEYQSIDNSANLRGQLYRFLTHGMFLAPKNVDVKKREDLKKTKPCPATDALGPRRVELAPACKGEFRSEREAVN